MDEKRKPTQQQRPHGGPGGHGMPRAFEKPKNTRRTLQRLMPYLKHKQLMLVLVLILLLVSTISSLVGNYLLKPLINDYILPGDFSGLAATLLWMGGLYLLGAAASYIQSRLMIGIAQKTTNKLRSDLFAKLQSLPLRYFDAHTHGDLMSRFTNDVDNVQTAMEQSIIQLLSSALAFVGSVVMMLVLNPLLFIITFLILMLMFFFSSKLAGISSGHFKDQQKNLGSVNGYIEEMVGGLKVVKVFTHEDEAITGFKKLNEDYRQSAFKANFYAAVAMPVIFNLNNISYASTALFGGILSIMTGFDIGSLAAFLQYSRHLGMPVQQITNQFNTILAAVAGAERVFEVMDQEPEFECGDVTLVNVIRQPDGSLVVNGDGAKSGSWAWKVPNADGSVQYIELKGDVRFEDVSFGYEPDKVVLHGLSFYAKPGQKIALVGSTGAGKTTITNLLNRFYDIHQGTVTYDGINIRRICMDDLRRSFGMVLQDTHLFSGTILDNIRYGRLDATNEDCIQAAKLVNAHSFIKRLPQGYQTLISADGTNLSQGQRQLLAITRAAIANPPVMILDEATSSIDTRTEKLIEKGMDVLMEGRTVFVIAHRLSTVRNAKAILVIEDGRIIERGDHEDLIRQKGRYYQLYTGQYELD
jgi:ATP-binding cassette subfamily B multidrug efflux pump